MALVPRDPWASCSSRYGGYRRNNYSLLPSSHALSWFDQHRWPTFHGSHSTWFEESRHRFLEMEKRFEHFMRKVDDRFSGMLSLVDVDSEPRFSIPVHHDEEKPLVQASDNGRFRIDINVQDFKPEEVTVKVAEGKACVHAKRETKNEDCGMYAYTFREFRRTFALPKGMRTEDVSSSLSEDGILKIEGQHSLQPTVKEIPINVLHEAIEPSKCSKQ